MLHPTNEYNQLFHKISRVLDEYRYYPDEAFSSEFLELCAQIESDIDRRITVIPEALPAVWRKVADELPRIGELVSVKRYIGDDPDPRHGIARLVKVLDVDGDCWDVWLDMYDRPSGAWTEWASMYYKNTTDKS